MDCFFVRVRCFKLAFFFITKGMTLDCVEISLLRVFEYGQAYVALSRAKSLENTKILDFDVSSIKADETVLKYYAKISRGN